MIGGDPSKQNIVLDGEVELQAGMKFKFLIKGKSELHPNPKNFSICFSVDHNAVELDQSDSEIADAPLTASSKEGGIVGGFNSPCVISSIPDSYVYL